MSQQQCSKIVHADPLNEDAAILLSELLSLKEGIDGKEVEPLLQFLQHQPNGYRFFSSEYLYKAKPATTKAIVPIMYSILTPFVNFFITVILYKINNKKFSIIFN